jgi:hypothetical protein
MGAFSNGMWLRCSQYLCSHVKFHRLPLVTIFLYEGLSASSQPDQMNARQSPRISRLLVLDLDKDLVCTSSTLLLILVGLDRILKPALSHDIVSRRRHLVLFNKANNQGNELG